MVTRIQGVDTLADLIDRLIVTCNKLAFFENMKRVEHGKPSPDVAAIASWDVKSRDCCELRSMLKARIDELLTEVVNSGEYKAMKEARTFRPPETRLTDLMIDRCMEVSDEFVAGIIAELSS